MIEAVVLDLGSVRMRHSTAERVAAAGACDAITLSFEVGVAKPEDAIHLHCLDRLGVEPGAEPAAA